jgi:phage shock protein C
MHRKLYRSRSDRMIGGVCGGLGAYLSLDPMLIRLFFVLLALGQGAGVLIYLILWFVLPVEGSPAAADSSGVNVPENAHDFADRAKEMGTELRDSMVGPNSQGRVVIGLVFVCLGILFLLQNLDISWLQWLRFNVLWPFLLIVGGLVLLVRGLRKEP